MKRYHIVKRDLLTPGRRIVFYLLAIAAALLLGALLLMMTGVNPLSYYFKMLTIGTVTDSGELSRLAYKQVENLIKVFVPLVLTSVALSVAFKMKFWNIGGEGQVLIGGLASAACMICLGNKLPNAAVILCMIVASIAAGAFWGFIPAFFKAKWNTNETLSTLMMNYIATQLVAFYTIVWEVPKGSGKIGIINQNTNVGWLLSLIHI